MAIAPFSVRFLPNPTVNPTRIGRTNPFLAPRTARLSLPLRKRRQNHLCSIGGEKPATSSCSESEESLPQQEESPSSSSSIATTSSSEEKQGEISGGSASLNKEEIIEDKGGGLLTGVGEEIREIEWPIFGKVLGTTGVVIAVIAGSSVVLLTVNAILAELSDRVFAGKGVQDFFG